MALEKVSKKFGPTLALDGATASLSGMVNLILGPNGSGKTTLVNCILGLARPESGTLEVDGEKFEASSGSQWRRGSSRVRQRSGFLGDRLGVPTSFTGREFLEWTAKIARRRADGGLTERVVSGLDLSSFLDKRIGSYSSGMQQKVALAGSLVAGPEIVFWDEPISNMDARGRSQVAGLVDRLSKNGMKFVIVSHSPTEFEPFVDWAGFMVQGRFAKAGSLAGLAPESDEFVAETEDPRKLAEKLVEGGICSEVRILESSVVFTARQVSRDILSTAEGLSKSTSCQVSNLKPLPLSVQKLYTKALNEAGHDG